MKILRIFLGFIFLNLGFKAFSQKPLNAPIDRGPQSKIELISADSLIGTSGGLEQKRTFIGHVKFRHRGVELYCDRAVHNVGSNDIQAFGRILINQGDTLTIKGDTLYYDGNIRFAQIFGKKVTLTDDSTVLVSKQVNYDLNNDLAFYPKKGIVTKDSSVLSSDKGYYNTSTKEFQYFGDVEIKTPTSLLCTDSLLYNSNTGLAIFETYTTITSSDGTLSADKGTYNTKTKQAIFAGRSQVENLDYYLTGDTLDFNNEAQEGFAKGNVQFYSKTESLYINGDFGEKLKEKAYTRMIGNTLTRKIDGSDTLYMRADSVIAYEKKASLVSIKLRDKDLSLMDSTAKDSVLINTGALKDSLEIHFSMKIDTLENSKIDFAQNILPSDSIPAYPEEKKEGQFEFLIATGNVKIYRSDFQSICDSLNYDLVDSIISFFGKPIIWNDDSQLIADSINAIMVRNKINRLFLNQSSFVISQDTVGNFNQIKGRQIVAIFDSTTAISQVNVDGNAESIYYALDETNKMVGLNRVLSSKMNLKFADRKVKRISFLGAPESKLIPPQEIDDKSRKLPDFDWKINLKPRKTDVIGVIFDPSKMDDESTATRNQN